MKKMFAAAVSALAIAAASPACGKSVVITADRGLRARLPDAATTIGPGWWNTLLGR